MKKRILVADDEQALRMLIGDMLSDDGYEVELATNGKEALAKIRSHDYDLVILDYMMPEMSGLEVISLTRQLPDKQNLLIMMLTAKSQQSDLERVMDSGANYYMTKPFSPMELSRKIGEILNVRIY